jgi:hypothetical protein
MILSEQDQQELAQKLAKMNYRKARKEIRRLDPEADLKIWRNAVGPETHTMYELPTFGIRVILVEERHGKTKEGRKGIMMNYLYTEARVEPIK